MPDRPAADRAEPMTAAAQQQLITACDQWCAYDSRRGGDTGIHTKVVVLEDGELRVVVQPKSSGKWRLEKLTVPGESSLFGPSQEHSLVDDDLAWPEFVAAGPMSARYPGIRANTPLLIAHGSRLLWHGVVGVWNSTTRGLDGLRVYAAVDLREAVGPSADAYRIFMEGGPARRGEKRVIAHLLPWRDDRPDPTQMAYSLRVTPMIGRISVSVIPRMLTA